MSSYLELHPGGKLIRFRWNGQQQKYDEVDVTSMAPRLLWSKLRVVEQTTIEDVFLLLNQHMDIFDMILGNWCREFTSEILSSQDIDDELEYAVLNWLFTLEPHDDNEQENVFYGHHFPRFGVVGKDGVTYELGYRSAKTLRKLSLRLESKVELFDEHSFYLNQDYENPAKYRQYFDHSTYTLGDVLYGIIWELSYYGSPTSRKALESEVNQQIADFENDNTF